MDGTRNLLDQFDPYTLHPLHEFLATKRIPLKPIHQFNHRFLFMYQRVQSLDLVVDNLILIKHYYWGLNFSFATKVKGCVEATSLPNAFKKALLLAQFGGDTRNLDSQTQDYNPLVLTNCHHLQPYATPPTVPTQMQSFSPSNYHLLNGPSTTFSHTPYQVNRTQDHWENSSLQNPITELTTPLFNPA